MRIPASTSNLGPGFDALGLALDIHVTVTATLADRCSITISGEGPNTFRAAAITWMQLTQPEPTGLF